VLSTPQTRVRMRPWPATGQWLLRDVKVVGGEEVVHVTAAGIGEQSGVRVGHERERVG
jgi:hypothetical protein